MKIYLSIIFFGILLSCTNRKESTLNVIASGVDAVVKGNILEGPSVLNDSNRFVWGGSVIQGYDGKFHMLYSTWECGDSVPPFQDSWVLNSKIAYAVSDFPDRDFKFQKIILKGRIYDGDSTAWDAQMVDNPHLKKFNGKYYLYYGGSSDPGVQPIGSKAENLVKRSRVQQNQKIGVIEFNNFEDLMAGNFMRNNSALLSPRTRVKPDQIVNPSPEGTEPKTDNIIVVSPSVVRRPSDGKFLLYFKGNFYNPNWRGVHGVAISESPTGPFVALDDFVFDIKIEDGKIASAEDPFVWYHHSQEKFYVDFKDFTGKITDGQPGLALLESKDGISWAKPEKPFFMKKEVKLKNGEIIKVNRLERPQLLIDKMGEPQVLYCACAIVNVNPRTDGTSFNVHIPLQVKQ